MESEGAIGPLRVRQAPVDDGGALLEHYDLVLTTVSWESRSNTALPLMVGRSKQTKFIRFASDDGAVSSRKDVNQEQAARILKAQPELISLDRSTSWHGNFRKLSDVVSSAAKSFQRPISVLLDMTCLPKRYMLAMLGQGFTGDQVGRMDILYSEAASYEATMAKSAIAVGLVSDGEWSPVQIPFLEGREYVPDKRDLFISLGGEITSALPIVERFEPRELRIYHVKDTELRLPAAQYDGEGAARKTLAEYPNSYSLAFDLHDVVGLAKDVLRAQTCSTTCFAIGSKPHALAFGLARLANDLIQVVCRAPGRYLPNDAKPSGKVHLYQIQDRFDPRWYWARD